MDEFGFKDFLWRLLFSLALVLATFNPSGQSFYHWALGNWPGFTPGEVIAGIVLLGLWIFFIRSTLLSLGPVGVALILGLFAAIVWWVVRLGWLEVANRATFAWLVLGALGLLLGVGMSWSHLRRRWSGQASVDRVDA